MTELNIQGIIYKANGKSINKRIFINLLSKHDLLFAGAIEPYDNTTDELEINGSLYETTDKTLNNDTFITLLEANGLLFAGVTRPVVEDAAE